jgi:Holliday junction resolvasome RuvABC endonuclease subunit
MILSIDAATKTGWALIDKGKVLESGVQDFSKKRGESNGAMFLKARRWLMSMILDGHEVAVDLIAFEQAHNRGGAATEICNNLIGRILEVAAIVNEGQPKEVIQTVPYHSATIKKWATGSGRAEKSAMIARAKKELGRDPIDDNEADAVLIGLMAWEEYGI